MLLSHAALKCCRHRASTLSRNNGFASSSSIAIAAARASTTSTSLQPLLLLRALPTARQRQQWSAQHPNYYYIYYGIQQQLHYYTSSPSLFAENAAATVSSAQLVKQLRESTGAPMMECKKALSSPEVNNDLQLAKEWLRKHGSAKAISKVAGREALEGLVGMHIITPEVHGQNNGNGPTAGSVGAAAALVKVSSETDFASRSAIFSTFVQEVAVAAAAASAANTAPSTNTTTNTTTNMEKKHGDHNMDIPTFLSNATTRTGKTFHEALNDAILAIRENLSIDTISVLKSTETPSSSSSPQHSSVVVFGGYVHGKVAPDVNCGSAAAIVELQVLPTTNSSAANDDDDADAARISIVQEAAKKLAMHIVAAKPLYINIDSVPPEVVQKEKEILLSKMELEASSSENSIQKKSKKAAMTPEIQDKILSGQLRKYYESICLTEQPHMVEEGNIKVSKVLAQLGMAVKDFRLMSMTMNK